MPEENQPITGESLSYAWSTLQARLTSRAPARDDIPDLEAWLAAGLRARTHPWQLRQTLPGPAAVAALTTLDLNRDGQAEIIAVYQDGQVGCLSVSAEEIGLRAALPPGYEREMPGLLTYPSYWGGLQAGVAVLEAGAPCLYEIAPDFSRAVLELRRQPLPSLTRPAAWPAWVGSGAPTHRLEVTSGPPDGRRRRYQVTAQGLALSAPDGVWDCPFQPRCVIADGQAIYLAGRSGSILQLPWQPERRPLFPSAPAWQHNLGLAVTALALYPGAPATLWAAREDGMLQALAVTDGRLLGDWRLPAPAYSLTLGDVDGDGSAELVAGLRDGRCLILAPTAPDAAPSDLEQWIEQALRWLVAAGATKDSLARRWLAGAQPELAAWALDWLGGQATPELVAAIVAEGGGSAERLWQHWQQRPPSPATAAAVAGQLHAQTLTSDRRRLLRDWQPIPGAAQAGNDPPVDWIDAQQGARLRWRLSLPGVVTAMGLTAGQDETQAAIWMAAADGKVWRCPLAAPEPVLITALSTPACALIPDHSGSGVWAWTAGGQLLHIDPHAPEPDLNLSLMSAGWGAGRDAAGLWVSGDGGLGWPGVADNEAVWAAAGAGLCAPLLASGRPTGAAIAEAGHRFFTLLGLAGDVTRLTVDLPAPLLCLLAWPDAHGVSLVAVFCADEQLYVFNQRGELLWQRSPAVSRLLLAEQATAGGEMWPTPCLTLAPSAGDDAPRLGVALGDRVVLYSLDGHRAGEFGLDMPIRQVVVGPVISSEGAARLILGALSPQGGLWLFEALTDNERATAQRSIADLEPAAANEAVAYWAARAAGGQPGYSPAMAIMRLGELACGAEATAAEAAAQVLGGLRLPAAAPVFQAAALVWALMQAATAHTQPALHVALRRWLAGAAHYPRLHQMVILQLETWPFAQRLGQPLPEAWVETLTQAVCADSVLRHGYSCIVTSLFVPEQPQDAGWWSVLKALTESDGAATDSARAAARKAVAHRLLDTYRADRVAGWQLLHRLADNGVHPDFLGALLGGHIPRLTQDASEQKLFQAMYRFFKGRGEEQRQALHNVAEQVGQADRRLLAEPAAAIYLDLERLIGLNDGTTLQEFFEGGVWTQQIAPYLNPPPVSADLLLHFGPALELALTAVRRGLDEVRQHGGESRLRRLRDLSTAVAGNSQELAQQAEAARQAGRYATAAWLEALAGSLRRWAQGDGALGRWLHNLSSEFQFSLRPFNPRLMDGELRLEFEIINQGLAIGSNLVIEAPEIHLRTDVLPCELEPGWTAGSSLNLGPGQRLSGRLRSALGARAQTITGQKVRVSLRLAFTQESRQQRTASAEVEIPTTLEAIDYPRQFPLAWRQYSGEVRKWLNRRGRVLLVDLDRWARRSFLEAAQVLAPAGETRLVNLRPLYARLRQPLTSEGRPVRLRAQDIQVQIAQELNPALPLADGANYRQHFLTALRASAQSVTCLFLNHFDYLVLKLLADKDGEEALAESLDFWRELAADGHLRLVLGCSFLTEKILQARYPGFWALCEVIRPNYLLTATPTGRQEALTFLEQELQSRSLLPLLTEFNPPATPEHLLYLCGGNLFFLRALVIEGLELARRSRQDQPDAIDLSRMNASDYLVNHGFSVHFLSMAWLWLGFYEKIALTLLAHAEFAVENQNWLGSLVGLTLSRPYAPGTPRGPSRRAEAVAGEELTPVLAGKVRSSRYYSGAELWLAGYVHKRAVAFGQDEYDRTGQMCLRLLRAANLDRILEQLRLSSLLVDHPAGRELDNVVIFRIPLWREFFRRSQVYSHLVAAAQGQPNATWYPPELHLNRLTRQPLFSMYPHLKPVYRSLPVSDLPAIETALAEDRDGRQLFLNFYGLGAARYGQWRDGVALISALYGAIPQTEGDVRTQFDALNKLLDVKPARQEQPPRLASYGVHSVAWQMTAFGNQVLPGLRSNFLIGLVADGQGWDAPALDRLRQAVSGYWRQTARAMEAGNDNGDRAARKHDVVILIVLRQGAALRQALAQRADEAGITYVVLDDEDIGEVVTAALPSRQLIRLCQQQVGRVVLSPYQARGPLSPGSDLFVGRKAQLRSIMQRVGQTPSLIFGSRRIGKTSLLRQVQGRLEEDPAYLPLWVAGSGHRDVLAFFEQVRLALEKTKFAAYALQIGQGEAAYAGLPRALGRLQAEGGPLPVFLLDEVDELYRLDRQQDERLFNLLRNLSQSSPRLCGLVMTGYRQIFFRQHDRQSVFYNFGDPFFLREVEEDELAYLVRLLKEYQVEFYDDQDAVRLILQGAYHIPYLVQAVCLRLLERLDLPGRLNPNRLEIADIEIALAGEVEDSLTQELIRNISLEGETRAEAQMLQARYRILLYAVALGKYAHTLDSSEPFRPLASGDEFFTVRQALEYLHTWADRLEATRPWSYGEVDDMLQELRMTLAIGAVEGEAERRYYFAQDIVPRLLQRYYQRPGRGGLLDDLSADIDLYTALARPAA